MMLIAFPRTASRRRLLQLMDACVVSTPHAAYGRRDPCAGADLAAADPIVSGIGQVLRLAFEVPENSSGIFIDQILLALEMHLSLTHGRICHSARCPLRLRSLTQGER